MKYPGTRSKFIPISVVKWQERFYCHWGWNLDPKDRDNAITWKNVAVARCLFWLWLGPLGDTCAMRPYHLARCFYVILMEAISSALFQEACRVYFNHCINCQCCFGRHEHVLHFITVVREGKRSIYICMKHVCILNIGLWRLEVYIFVLRLKSKL